MKISNCSHPLIISIQRCHTDEFKGRRERRIIVHGSVTRYGPRTSCQRNGLTVSINCDESRFIKGRTAGGSKKYLRAAWLVSIDRCSPSWHRSSFESDAAGNLLLTSPNDSERKNGGKLLLNVSSLSNVLPLCPGSPCSARGNLIRSALEMVETFLLSIDA